MEELMCSSVKL